MTSSIRKLGLASFLALRLVRSRRSPTLSLVTTISVLGIAFGVMALTVVLGVTNGFQRAFQDRILGLYPHMVVLKRATDFREYPQLLEELRATPGVVGASPATYDDMMIAAGVQRSGAVIKGIELSSVDSVVPLRKLVKSGSLDALEEAPVLARDGDRITIDAAIAGTWSTLVITDGAPPELLTEDRTPPDAGNTRLSVLDLRGEKGIRLVLEPVDRPSLDLELPRDELRLDLSVPGGHTEGREVDAGTWRLALTGEQLSLPEGTITTLVLMPGDEGGVQRTRLLVEPARLPVAERAAMLRVVDARTSGDPITVAPLKSDVALPAVGPGEFSAYSAIPGQLPGVVLGTALAARLDAKVGDEITLVTPLRGVDNKMLGPYGMAPSSAHHRVVGTFESGFYEYDVRLALVNLEAVMRFMNRGRVIRWIEVRADDVFRVDEVKKRVAATVDPYDLETLVDYADAVEDRLERLTSAPVGGVELREKGGFIAGLRNSVRILRMIKYQEVDFGYRPRYRLIDWEEMNTNLFSALTLQKVVLSIFFLIIIVVGSFVVVGSQIMVIHDKTPDIAILKAMGATSGAIRTVFTLQGVLVASIGTLVGLLLGAATVGLIASVKYELDASIYLIDRLPVQVNVLEWVLVAAATLVCTLVATQYSAGRAAAKTPVEGLRAVD